LHAHAAEVRSETLLARGKADEVHFIVCTQGEMFREIPIRGQQR
jgi:hypothetical protein